MVLRKLVDVREENTASLFRIESFYGKNLNFSAQINYRPCKLAIICRKVLAKTAGSFRFICEIYLRKPLLSANDESRPFVKVGK